MSDRVVTKLCVCRLRDAGGIPSSLRIAIGLVAVFAGLLATAASAATLFQPLHDDEVLADVAVSIQSSAASSQDAWRLLERATRDGDQRWVGRAQVLALRDEGATQNERALLHATIAQRKHDFSSALLHLEAADPSARKLLLKATVLITTGRRAEAADSCLQLARFERGVAQQGCLAQVMAATGQVEAAASLLRRSLSRRSGTSSKVRGWALGLLAEFAWQLGDVEQGIRYAERAIELSGPTIFLLALKSDMYLSEGRWREASAMLPIDGPADELLVRQAIALTQLQDSRAQSLVAILQDRFTTASDRGDKGHQGLEARFRLDVTRELAPALALAMQSLAIQRAPADVVLAVRAAAAVGDSSQATNELLQWITDTGFVDARIEAAVAKLDPNRA